MPFCWVELGLSWQNKAILLGNGVGKPFGILHPSLCRLVTMPSVI